MFLVYCSFLYCLFYLLLFLSFFFFNDPATTEIYTLSLHDALPISVLADSSIQRPRDLDGKTYAGFDYPTEAPTIDRKSTRLNSSHQIISYAVFCLKKKKKNKYQNL